MTYVELIEMNNADGVAFYKFGEDPYENRFFCEINKEELETGIATPRTPYVLYKIRNGKKYYMKKFKR